MRAYCEQAARKSDLDRTDLAKDKTGVFTGSFAANPANIAPVPIWVADYVLASYGTGAIMAVPAHDTRDFEFAKTVRSADRRRRRSARKMRRSTARKCSPARRCSPARARRSTRSTYNGLTTAEFKAKITADLVVRAVMAAKRSTTNCATGCSAGNIFGASRFRCLHELDAEGRPTGLVRTVPAEELPVNLPDLKEFQSHGSPEPPLEQAPEDWLYPTDRRPPLQARNQHHAAMGRLVLVLLAISRPQERSARWLIARWKQPGCRSTFTSAAPSMPCCTCSTPASGTRCSTIAAW